MKSNKSDLMFTPNLQEFYRLREEKPFTVLSGGNNSGKSLVLKYLKQQLGKKAYMIAPSRFSHVYQLSTAIVDPNELDNFENQFNNQFNQEQYNYEQNFLDLNKILTNLGDVKRNSLFDLCGELIGNKFTLRKLDDGNELSVRYIDMDGQNLSVGSTGTRLLMTMLGICMDDRFSTILIDEPELGLSPKVQQSFSNFLQNEVHRKKYFPHLKQVFIATHSHMFLDKNNNIENNYVVSKSGLNINIQQIKTMIEFHRLQFNQLGNTFESLFLPSAIVVVEGPTDFEFLDKVIQIKFPERKIIVQQANGDGEVKRKINDIKNTFGNLSKSPFGNRLFVVLDSIHSKGLKSELITMGMQSDNIVVWDKNGIEYVYPEKIIMEIFSCSAENISKMTVIDDTVSIGTVQYKKAELSKEVLKKLNSVIANREEIESKLLKPLNNVLS